VENQSFSIRLSARLRENMERQAALQGLKATEWVKMLVAQACKPQHDQLLSTGEGK
jgi:hypothetical protein